MTVDTAASRAAARPHALLDREPAWAGTRPLLIPLAMSLVILVAGLFTLAPVQDAVTSREVADVSLGKPITYVLLAPVSDVLDALTLLSARQHVAGLLGALALWAMWRSSRPRGMRQDWVGISISFSTLVACILVAYASVALLPRPMAYLASADPDLIRVDFHSHTKNSRDAHQTFTAESNRAWHRGGGYDVAYVTDHKALAEAQRGRAKFLPGGRKDVILLPGIEADWMGEHVGLLGSEPTIRDMLSANLRNLVVRRSTVASNGSIIEPILIWNHPRADQLEKLPIVGRGSTVDVRAIEISNGAPHGMDLVRRKRQQIVDLARKYNLALTSGTDSHGWGYVAPNWTLLRIKNWRDLNEEQLATRIEGEIREHGFNATRVMERTTVDPGMSTFALAATIFIVPWRMLTTLTAEEREMWMAWIWAIAGVGLLRRRLAGKNEIPLLPTIPAVSQTRQVR